MRRSKHLLIGLISIAFVWGAVMHIALPITPARYAEVKARLDEGGTAYEEVGGSLYVKDPNQLGIELLPTD